MKQTFFNTPGTYNNYLICIDIVSILYILLFALQLQKFIVDKFKNCLSRNKKF